jgi:hypothetical protein
MDEDVSNIVRFDRNSVENKIQTLLADKDYGNGISYWGHILIASTPEVYNAGFFKEIKKYRKKKTELELRLRVDYKKLKKADNSETLKLICESILKGVDIAEHELRIKDFEFASFRNDLTNLFTKEGWI